MKKILILLFLILSVRIISFSETISSPIEQESTVSITATELKYTNLIFIEHKRLLVDNSLLKVQVNNYSNLYNQQLELDNIRKEELDNCYSQIYTLQESLSFKDRSFKILTIGSISVSVGLLILFLVK